MRTVIARVAAVAARSALLFVGVAIVLGVASQRAGAADGDVVEFPVDTQFGDLNAMTAGADGNLWLVVAGGIGDHVARLTLDGEYSEFQVQGPGGYEMIATDDGAIWMTQWGSGASAVTRIVPSADGKSIETDRIELDADAQPRGIVVGPDGAIWFAEWNVSRLGRIDPNTLDWQEFAIDVGAPGPERLATYNGSLWVTTSGSELLEVDGSGAIVDRMPLAVAANDVIGTEGALFYAAWDRIHRLTADGSDVSFDVGRTTSQIVVDGRGFVWYTFGDLLGNGGIGRLDPNSGSTEEFFVPSESGAPRGSVTIGPDGAVWVAESRFSAHPDGPNVVARFQTGVEVVPDQAPTSESSDPVVATPALRTVADLHEAFTVDNAVRSGGITFVLLVFVMLPSMIINHALNQRYAKLVDAPLLQRARSPFWSHAPGILTFAAIVAALSALQSCLADWIFDTGYGFVAAALGGVAAFGTGALVTTSILLAIEGWSLRRVAGVEDPGLTAKPATLLITAVAVALSAVLSFEPVLMFGVLVGYAAAERLRGSDRGRSQLVSGAVVFIAAIAAWAIADGFVPESLPNSVGLAIFVAGIEWLFIGLIPIPRLPGWALFRWHWWVSLGLWTSGTYLFVLGVVTPGVDHVRAGSLIVLVGVLVLLNAGAFTFWWRSRAPAANAPATQ